MIKNLLKFLKEEGRTSEQLLAQREGYDDRMSGIINPRVPITSNDYKYYMLGFLQAEIELDESYDFNNSRMVAWKVMLIIYSILLVGVTIAVIIKFL